MAPNRTQHWEGYCMISGGATVKHRQWRAITIVLVYSLVTVLLGAILKRTGSPEQLLILLMIPILAVSINRPRSVYLPMIFVIGATALWVTQGWTLVLDQSQITIAATSLCLVVACEVIRGIERKTQLAQEALRKSRERYDTMAQSSMDGFWVIDSHGFPIEVNDAYCKMSGYSREALLATPLTEIEYRETPEQVAERTKKIKEIGWDRFESQHRRADGTVMDVEVSAIYLASHDMFMASVHDVSVRKKSERELLDTRDRLAATLNALPDLLFEIGRDGRILDFRAPQPELLYMPPERFLGRTMAEVLPADAAAVISRAIADAVDKGFHRGSEYSLPMPGGTEWFELAVAAKGDRTAPDARFVVLVRDITERKRAEELLRESESLLRESEVVARLGTYILDIATGLWKSSKVLDDIFGIDSSFIHSVDGWTSLIHPDYREMMSRYFAEEVVGKHVLFDKEYKIIQRSTGEVRWVHGLGRLEFDSSDHPIRMFGTIQDITARKDAEAERERLEEQLRQSQKMEAVGQLAGGIAHDFNNLLQAILGYTEFVLDDLTPEDRHRTELMQAHLAAERAATLTRQLLAYSRKQVLNRQPLDLNDVIAELMRMIRRVIGEHIEFEVIPGHDLALVNADRGQLEQVLTNLCLNARDAMPDGGRLTIKTENTTLEAGVHADHEWASPGRYVRIGVTDSGAGMEREVVQRVFEPFFTTKDIGKGTGLGLATVHGIVRQHDGAIQVESEPGKGTTFSVYLPAVDTAKRATVAESVVIEPVRGGHETILLAEDEEQIRSLAKRILESAGYTVIDVVDGEEALRVYETKAHVIDLLVLDVVMPKKNGRAVLDEIRAKVPQQKCLFVSGYSEDAVHTRFVLDTGLRLLQKPYQRNNLLRAVRDVLDQ